MSITITIKKISLLANLALMMGIVYAQVSEPYDFKPVQADTLEDFNTLMGLEIAIQIKLARDEGRDIIVILSAGPMGMYRWAAEFLNAWNIYCGHVHGFNMDEWSDSEGNTLPPSHPGAFRNAMEKAFYAVQYGIGLRSGEALNLLINGINIDFETK